MDQDTLASMSANRLSSCQTLAYGCETVEKMNEGTSYTDPARVQAVRIQIEASSLLPIEVVIRKYEGG